MRLMVPALLVAVLACGGKRSNRPAAGRDGGDAAVEQMIDAAPTTPPGTAPPYLLAPLDGDGKVVGSGRVEVTVEWPTPPAAAVRSQGVNSCNEPHQPATRVATLHGVSGVVVTLEGVARGRPAPPAEPVELRVMRCRLTPSMVVMPRIGAVLGLVNDDERRHQLRLERLGDGAGAELVAEIPLALVGRRVELPLARAGTYRVVSLADLDQPAYLVVPAHPYVAITDDSGQVAFDDVPPGEYQLVAWHPPIAEKMPPIIKRASVLVATGTTATAKLSLAD